VQSPRSPTLRQAERTVELELDVVAYDSAMASVLIEEIQADLAQRYGGPDETPVDPADFAPPSGLFVVARLGCIVIGCAGLRRHDEGVVELKRMFVISQHRRRGLARLLLAQLEDRARAAGYLEIVLETGTAQPEAITLYESAGYTPRTPFGYYAGEEMSRTYGKAL